jgi:hypothetical protein
MLTSRWFYNIALDDGNWNGQSRFANAEMQAASSHLPLVPDEQASAGYSMHIHTSGLQSHGLGWIILFVIKECSFAVGRAREEAASKLHKLH